MERLSVLTILDIAFQLNCDCAMLFQHIHLEAFHHIYDKFLITALSGMCVCVNVSRFELQIFVVPNHSVCIFHCLVMDTIRVDV